MSVMGFNVGSTLDLGDMSLVIDYLIDRDSFEPNLQDIKDKIRTKENSIKSPSN